MAEAEKKCKQVEDDLAKLRKSAATKGVPYTDISVTPAKAAIAERVLSQPESTLMAAAQPHIPARRRPKTLCTRAASRQPPPSLVRHVSQVPSAARARRGRR